MNLSCNSELLMFDGASVSVNERIIVGKFKAIEHFFDKHAVVKMANYCFFLFEEGEAEIEINGNSFSLSEGMLICAIPGDLWKWNYKKAVKGKFVFFEASFPLAGLKGGYSLEPISYLNSNSRQPVISLSKKLFGLLKYLGDDMYECYKENPVHWDLLRAQLWVYIFQVEKEFMTLENTTRKQEKENRVADFLNLVNKYFRTNHEVGFYASELNITPNYLNKIVKNTTGSSARDIILGRIISEAKILLRLTEITVSELAYKLGFEDPSYFIRYFKKIEGVTPGDYQKQGTL